MWKQAQGIRQAKQKEPVSHEESSWGRLSRPQWPPYHGGCRQDHPARQGPPLGSDPSERHLPTPSHTGCASREGSQEGLLPLIHPM